MIDLYANKQDCCGCTACEHSCSRQAITMSVDERGFLYPVINPKLCVGCGICKEVCAFQNGYDTKGNLEMPKVYAVKHRSDEVRLSSSSGGMFTAISDSILKNGGYVYGVAFDDDLRACHIRAETARQRDRFKGSKYVQSYLGDTFNQVKQDLLSNKVVMFTGTPCQVAGLKSYLRKYDEAKLYTVDIVCKGVPSPKLWNDWVAFVEQKHKSQISDVTFRSKLAGWHNLTFSYQTYKRTVYESLAENPYCRLFIDNYSLRDSCYNCAYCNITRPSDITIADYWGVEKSIPEFDDNKGVSLVLINTKKGSDLFASTSGDINLVVSNTLNCRQTNLHSHTLPPQARQSFWDDYLKRGSLYCYKKYAEYSLNRIFKRKIRIGIKALLTKMKVLHKFNRLRGLDNKIV